MSYDHDFSRFGFLRWESGLPGFHVEHWDELRVFSNPLAELRSRNA